MTYIDIEEYGKGQQQHDIKKQQRSCKNQIRYISTHIGPYQEWNEHLKYTITVFKYC